MRVYLAEKRQQGLTLAQVLAPQMKIDFKDSKSTSVTLPTGDCVTWCRGHVYELAEPDHYDPALKDWSLDTLPFRPARWALTPIQDAKRQIKAINDLIARADEVAVCTDFGREGQYLGLNAVRMAGFRGRILRVRLQALSRPEVERALRGIEDIGVTMPLYESAVARAHSDWLVGINLSRLFTLISRSMGGGGTIINLGRVLTPTVNMVVERDAEIAAFKPGHYYEIYARLRGASGAFVARWRPAREIMGDGNIVTDRSLAEQVAAKVRGRPFTITRVERKELCQHPPLPFDLDGLQIHCNRHHGFAPDKTLSIAQRLYDHQFTSYPRTDSTFLPESQLADAPAILAHLRMDKDFAPAVAGCDVSIHGRAFSDRRQAGHEHNAIIPTLTGVNTQTLPPDDFTVYDAIRRFYVAQFYPDAVYDTVAIEAECEGERFTATGRTLREAGFLAAFGKGHLDECDLSPEKVSDKRDSDGDGKNGLGEFGEHSALPPVEEGEACAQEGLEVAKKQTRPPKHFTEATLLRAMKCLAEVVDDPAMRENLRKKNAGLGTQATRADTIRKMLDGNWCERKGKSIVSTEKARLTMGSLPRAIKSPVTTAEWEWRLDAVARGQGSGTAFEDGIYNWIGQVFEACLAPKAKEVIARRLAPLSGEAFDPANAPKCPRCGAPMRKVFSKATKRHFWACTDREGCGLTADDAGGRPQVDHTCPDCGSPLRRIKGKSGTFWGCTNRECKRTFPDLSGRPVTKTPQCPVCGGPTHLVTPRPGGKKFDPFFSCDAFKSTGCRGMLDRFGRPFSLRRGVPKGDGGEEAPGKGSGRD